MREYPVLDWIERCRERVHADPELQVIGNWYTTTFALTFGENRFALEVDRGKIVEVVAAPRLDVRTLFGLRAPIEVSSTSLSPTSPRRLAGFSAGARRTGSRPSGGCGESGSDNPHYY